MGSLAGPMQVGGNILDAAGKVYSGEMARAAGRRSQVEREFEAAQYEQNAGQAVAAAQRSAFDEERRAKYVASRALAVAAAGGGASDPTVVKTIADITGEGAYRAGVALYGGESEARKLMMAAQASHYEGEVAKIGGEEAQRSYDLSAVGSLFKAGGTPSEGSLYENYGRFVRSAA